MRISHIYTGRPKDYWDKKTGKPRYFEVHGEYVLIKGGKDNELRDLAAQYNLEGYLEELAGEINQDYYNFMFDWNSIKFVFGQSRIWGNCRARTREIRISYRVLAVGELEDSLDKALGYLLTHELCHLKHIGHGANFWRLADRNPICREGYQILKCNGYMPCTDGSINY